MRDLWRSISSIQPDTPIASACWPRFSATGKRIEIFLACRIPDRRALGALDDAASGLVQLRHVAEGMDVMGRVDGAEIGQRSGRSGHGASPHKPQF